MSNIIMIDDNDDKIEFHNDNSNGDNDNDGDEDEHWNQTKPDRALLQKLKGVRSLFVVPGSTSSALSSSSSAIVRPPRFINFTQILINRNKKYRNGELNLNKITDKKNGKLSISTTISPVNNIKKKFIRLSSTTALPSNAKPSKSSKMINFVKTNSNTAIASKSTSNKKKTLVKVKVKNGDQHLLLYDHHKLKSSMQRNATTTSTTTTAPTTTTVLPPKITTMSLAEITRSRELNRKKKQDHFLDTTTTMNPLEEEDNISTLFSNNLDLNTDVINDTNTEMNTEPFLSDYTTPFPINMTGTEMVI